MTSVGIVGGLGPESTIDYYRRILEAWEGEDPSTAPSIVIDSLDVRRALHLVETDRPALIEYLLASVRRLAGAGVDFVAMTANTPHIVFDEMAARSPVPLLSIVEVCAQEAQRRGFGRLALLGTRFTMEGPFYPAVCARYGIAVVTPKDAERAWVHERYVGQLLRGEFRDDTRREFISLVGRLRAEEGVDGVILGGTELPLLLASAVIADVPVLDTTALHVAAIVNRLRQAERSRTSPSGVALCGAATVFAVQDVVRSVEHYRDVLGFRTEFTYGQPTFYAGVERDGVTIHLQAASETRRQPGHGAVNVFVTDVDALYQEVKVRGAKTLNEPKDYPYGMRDFDVEDLDGNHLCFGMESKPPRSTA